ncbi:glycosyltransferase family 4 protein [Bacteroides sp. 224]|uniref:glycosyltransferase family 4 protein n=1 Tax=Bacteroides sp. 224 TaxID=2302936 RepID=UPI0013D17F50|nr:glycosyltransferase family 4 protein [Bacteroides sp. 224]NDV65190.1 glycosyltransferase family 1 protein [Bacteroides sp. 224]
MKALFLIFHGFEESNGISKKIRYQISAFKECGVDIRNCYYDIDKDNNRKWIIDNQVLVNFGNSIWGKIKKRFCFNAILEYIIEQEIDFVYIRSYHNANPFTINFISKIKKRNIKVVMEIPTYPYDQEYITLRMKLDLWVDKLFRRRLARETDAIVTFSNEPVIFGKQTIRISNGIDFSKIKIKQPNSTSHSTQINLIGVAEVHYWHGFDRVVQGLADYYKSPHNTPVYFHIVGDLTGEREKRDILVPIKENNLEKYVILHGRKFGKELDSLFNEADFGIGSLGRHRSNITYIKTLKNREYAARGIPFAYSEIDEDFEQMPYILKEPADETPINIQEIVDFYHSRKWNSTEIRASIKYLSWKNQMGIVLKSMFSSYETEN